MPTQRNDRPNSDSVLIELPVSEVPTATWGLHINTHLTPEQSHALRRVTAALDERLARLSNGRRVVNSADTVKYLLERVCDCTIPSERNSVSTPLHRITR
jgi:hypothetical protein